MRSIVVMVGLTALVSVACKKEEPKAAAPTAAAPVAMPAVAPAPAPVALPMPIAAPVPGAAPAAPGQPPNLQAALQQGMQALAGAFGQPAAAGADGKPAAPLVNWKQLEPFLADKLGAWTAEGTVKGQTGGFGAMQVSTVKRTYKNGANTARVKIADTTMAGLMRMPFAMMANMNMDSSEGVKKGVTIGGHKGFVDWKKSGSSKASVLVAERYIVEVRVNQAASADEVIGVVSLINVAGLAGVK